MRKDRIAVLSVAVLMLFLTAVPVLAYFTTYVESSGGWIVQAEYETKLVEDVDPDRFFKSVHVENLGNSCPVYVRVRAFCPSDYEISYGGDAGWTSDGDGWRYFQDPVDGGGKTSELTIQALAVAGDRVPVDASGRDFNVVVVYEATPALWDTDGSPVCDWTQKALLPATVSPKSGETEQEVSQ